MRTLSSGRKRWTTVGAIVLAASSISYAVMAGEDDSTSTGQEVQQPMPVEPDGGIGDTPIPVDLGGGIGDTPIPVDLGGGIGDTPIPVDLGGGIGDTPIPVDLGGGIGDTPSGVAFAS